MLSCIKEKLVVSKPEILLPAESLTIAVRQISGWEEMFISEMLILGRVAGLMTKFACITAESLNTLTIVVAELVSENWTLPEIKFQDENM